MKAAIDVVGTPRRFDPKIIGICALLGILVFLVFGQTFNFSFVNYDDNWYVYQNPEVTAGMAPARVAGAFTRREGGIWTPLVTISHMIDWRLFGAKSGGHHLTNILLHLGSVVLLFLVMRRMTGALWRSAFVAALFAIHPLNVESVAWISERKDVLSGLFFMLTLGAYHRYVQRPASLGRYLPIVLFFALGLMCKPMLVTLPFVLLLIDYWPLQRLFLPPSTLENARAALLVNKRALVEKSPLLALSLVVCLVTILGQKKPGGIDIERIPFWTRMREAPVWLVTYLGQMIRPVNLTLVYTHFERSLKWWLPALAFCALSSVGIFLTRRRHPSLWMGWLWNLTMLLPVIGFVRSSRHARADHYNYLPQIGLYIGLTWLAADWAGKQRERRVALGAFAATALITLSVTAWHQASWWRDSIALWTHSLACTDDNTIAHNNLGIALHDLGRQREAVDQYRAALQINPSDAESHSNLGNILRQQGQVDAAIAQYRMALQINPDFAYAHYNLAVALREGGRYKEAIDEYREALRIDPSSAEAHNNLANALLHEGQTSDAINEYHEALRINPASAEAHNNLGAVLLGQGQNDEAIACFREAVRTNPAYGRAYLNLGAALLEQGQTDQAIAATEKALDLQPANPEIQNGLALMFATAPQTSLRNGARAIELATKANQATGGKNPLFLDTLAAAYAEARDFPKAVQIAQSALQIAEAQSNSGLADALRREIALYQAGHPFEDAH